jgi:hypothetical protein
MNRPPFAALKFSLALLALALALATAGVVWSEQQATAARLALETARGERATAQSRLAQSHEETRLVATHLDGYRALVARGFVGPEARLAWIEAAQLANRDAGLYGLDYRLAPRQAERPEYTQDLPLGSTLMTLTLPLLVETDLPRFLAALQARAPGLMRVRGCRLTRLSDGPFQTSAEPRLQAECELLWFTVAADPGTVQ